MPDMSSKDHPKDRSAPSSGQGMDGRPEGGDGPLPGTAPPHPPGQQAVNTGKESTTPWKMTPTSRQNAQHVNHHGNGDAQLVAVKVDKAKVSSKGSNRGEEKYPRGIAKKKTQAKNGSPEKAASVISVDIKKSTYLSEVKTSDVGPSDSASNLKLKQREASFVHTVRKEAKKLESTMPPSQPSLKNHKKKMKKGIFISYSPDAGFQERKFVVETIRQFKENNLAEDIWFDKDEQNTDSPCWFSFRMETVEKCRAAVLFLSDSFFSCPVSVYEGKTVLERQNQDPNSVKIFLVLFALSDDTEIPKAYHHLLKDVVDLTGGEHAKKSLAEKCSVVVGALMMDLERCASILAPAGPSTPPDTDFSGEYKKKRISQWKANDLQEWLFRLGIKEFYRQSLAENMVDGFLLMSMTDQDMVAHLGIDSRVVRKKIMQQILLTLDKEHKSSDSWHLRARTQRSRANTIYLVYDPTDVRLAQNLKQDLAKKGLQVSR